MAGLFLIGGAHNAEVRSGDFQPPWGGFGVPAHAEEREDIDREQTNAHGLGKRSAKW